MSFRYFKRRWDELRGDDYDNWGTSMWYFEMDADNYVTRQIEVYDNGKILKYDELHVEDEYGGLAEKAFDKEELVDFEPCLISRDEFEVAWAKSNN